MAVNGIGVALKQEICVVNLAQSAAYLISTAASTSESDAEA